ncbi:MAG: hypothetical protein ABI332_05585 [Polyangiaceae bacterium]
MRSSLVAVGLVAALLSGCAGSHGLIPAMQDVEKIRSGPAAQASSRYAPQMFAVAEQQRQKSRAAYDAGDDASAEIYAEQAQASYAHAFVLTRLAQATEHEAQVKKSLADADDDAARYAKARIDLQRDSDALEKKLAIARDALVPATSGPADSTREAARLVAARSLAMQARLLCGAAELADATAADLDEPNKSLADVEKQLDPAPKQTPIDQAARARSTCLATLTRTRRASDAKSSADALLTELSAAGDWKPIRDERGVVVTLRDLFQGGSLTKDATAKIDELGRVLAAHPGTNAQIVVHDSAPPAAKDAGADKEHGDAVAKALTTAAPNAKTQVQAAANRIAIVDPADAKHRARNARVDVVFVTSSN